MKKRIMQLIEAAALLTIAWMSGCDTGNTQTSASEHATAQTTALTVISQETALSVINTENLAQAPAREGR